MRQHVAAHQREHRMRLVERARDGELGVLSRRAPRASRATRSAGRNGESQGTVTTSGVRRVRQARVQAGERAGEAADRVGDRRG